MASNLIKGKVRLVILQEIFSHLQCATQWVTIAPENYVQYLNQAEALIELLENDDCGSIGGFDPKSPVEEDTLFGRFEAVAKRYNQISKIKPECNLTVNKLHQIFQSYRIARELEQED